MFAESHVSLKHDGLNDFCFRLIYDGLGISAHSDITLKTERA